MLVPMVVSCFGLTQEIVFQICHVANLLALTRRAEPLQIGTHFAREMCHSPRLPQSRICCDAKPCVAAKPFELAHHHFEEQRVLSLVRAEFLELVFLPPGGGEQHECCKPGWAPENWSIANEVIFRENQKHDRRRINGTGPNRSSASCMIPRENDCWWIRAMIELV